MMKPKLYSYNTSLTWGGERKGAMSSPGKPDIGVACPPEFGGHEGIWSPEDLFVASVELCTMTTFLWLLNKRGLEMISYESTAEGTAQMSGGAFVFTHILVRPVVTIPSKTQTGEIEALFLETAKLCLVSNSIKPEVKIKAIIIVGDNEK